MIDQKRAFKTSKQSAGSPTGDIFGGAWIEARGEAFQVTRGLGTFRFPRTLSSPLASCFSWVCRSLCVLFLPRALLAYL